MNLSKLKIMGGLLAIVAVISLVNMGAIVKLSNTVAQSQSAQLIKIPTSLRSIIRGGDDASNTPIRLEAMRECSSNTLPSFTVVTPNGGEAYNANSNPAQFLVKWSSCNMAGKKVRIVLMNLRPDNTYSYHTLVNETQNDGQEIVGIPQSFGGSQPLNYGNNFKVQLLWTNDVPPQGGSAQVWYYGDESNNFFSILQGPGGGLGQGNDCIPGTVIGYDSYGNPIYCDGGNGCVPGTIIGYDSNGNPIYCDGECIPGTIIGQNPDGSLIYCF